MLIKKLSVEQLLQDRDAMLDEIQFNWIKGQQSMKHYANAKHRELSFNEGDLVFIKVFFGQTTKFNAEQQF